MACRRLLFIVVFSIRPVRAARPSLCRSDHSWPKVAVHEDSAGRGEWSSPLLPVHPGDYLGIVAPAAIRDGIGVGEGSICGLEQAELAAADDRRGAVLDAQFAVQRALVGLDGVQ
jgi:hypothetical protein